MKNVRYWKLRLTSSIVAYSAIAFSGNCAFAQIIPDDTLAERSTVTPDVFKGIPIDRIDGGTQRGVNLFHSFKEFNVEVGKGAYFQNQAGIENILTRVTGNNPSQIFGKLGVLREGNANLFLINPQGIIFGSNASLDVRGSFVATTANAIGFGSQGFFSASAPNNPPILTVNPSALLFNQIAVDFITNNPISITNNSTRPGLMVPQDRSLLLVGGKVNFDGGTLSALGGRVELGGVIGEGTVGLSVDSNNLSLSYPQEVQLSDIYFSNASIVSASGSNIQLQARRVRLTNDSQILSIQRDNSVGNLTVNASESVELIGGSILSSPSLTTTSAGGETIINTRRLLVDKASVFTNSFSETGRGGNLTVNASESVEIANDSILSSGNQGSGDAGDIMINTRRLVVRDESQVSAFALGEGLGGNINIEGGSIQLSNNSSISTNAIAGGSGGNITINTDTLVGIENSDIRADANTGEGGFIKITAQGIFGLEVRELNENTSDINADSRRDPSLDGEVETITPEVDPSQGLVNFPENIVDATGLVTQGCPANLDIAGRGGSKFTVTGRGGLPPTPQEALNRDAVLEDWGKIAPTSNKPTTENQGDRTDSTLETPATPEPFVPATGWVISSNGEVTLTAQAPTVTPQNPSPTPASCNGT